MYLVRSSEVEREWLKEVGVTHLYKDVVKEVDAGLLVRSVADAVDLDLRLNLVRLGVGVGDDVKEVQLPVLRLDREPPLLPLIQEALLGGEGEGRDRCLLHHVYADVVIVVGGHIEGCELLLRTLLGRKGGGRKKDKRRERKARDKSEPCTRRRSPCQRCQ